MDGKWLQTERERLDHSRNMLRKQLGVDWHTYARARGYNNTAGLAQMIISYRLKYGRSAGQSPVEILAWVAHDLCQSGAA